MKKYYSNNIKKLVKEENLFILSVYQPSIRLIQDIKNPRIDYRSKCEEITRIKVNFDFNFNKISGKYNLNRDLIVKFKDIYNFEELLTGTLIPVGYICNYYRNLDHKRVYNIFDKNNQLYSYFIPIFEEGGYCYNSKNLTYSHEFTFNVYKEEKLKVNFNDANILNYSPMELKTLIKDYKELHNDVYLFKKQLDDAFEICQDSLLSNIEKTTATFDENKINYNRNLVKKLLYNDQPLISQKK